MSKQKFLAIADEETVYIEDSAAAVSNSIVNEYAVDYYPIILDEDNVPTIGGKVTISDAPRTTVKRIEKVTLAADGADIAEAEVLVSDEE